MKHEETTLNNAGMSLYSQSWLPETSPRAVLAVIHGLADHSGRYGNLVDYFLPKNFAVCALDLRGHGKSAGQRCYVNKFSEYTDDAAFFLNTVRQRYPDKPLYLVGHSVGGPVAISYAIKHQDKLNGLITSGANLASKVVSPLLVAAAGVISVLAPRTGVSTIDAKLISRDPEVVKAYVNDPLVFHGKIPARTGSELIHVWKSFPALFPSVNLPLLVLQGTADGLSDPSGSKNLYDRASSKDKTIKLYEGFFHEIFNEREHDRVFTDMEGWLNARL